MILNQLAMCEMYLRYMGSEYILILFKCKSH